jgi:hypothetical protein
LAALPILQAGAQGVIQQMGPARSGQVPMYLNSKQVLATGGALTTGASPVNQMNPGTLPNGFALVNPGLGNCEFSAYASVPYNQLCWGFDGNGNGVLSLSTVGGSPPQMFLSLNGTEFPLSGNGNVAGQSSPPTGVGDLALWANTGGSLLADNAGLSALAVPHGAVVMYPGGAVAPLVPWKGIGVGATAISTSGTTTSGFNEISAQMRAQPTPSMQIYGYGSDSVSTGIFGSTPLIVPWLRDQSIHAYGTFWGGTSLTTPALDLDSMVQGAFINEGGQIASAAGTGIATANAASVFINPTSTLEPEGFIGIAASQIQLGNLGVNASLGSSVNATLAMNFASPGGGMNSTTLEALEINGFDGAGNVPIVNNCVQVVAPTQAFIENFVHMADIHGCANVGWAEGTATGQAPYLFSNIEFFNYLAPAKTGSVGWDSFASNDFVVAHALDAEGIVQACGVLQPTAADNVLFLDCADTSSAGIAVGALIDPGATGNLVILTTKGTVTTPVNDISAAVNSYMVNGSWLSEFKGLGGTIQYDYRPINAPVSGTGATVLAGSTNSEGSVKVGSGNPTTVGLNFSVSFLSTVTCKWGVNLDGIYLHTGSSSTNALTGVTNAGATLPVNTIVSYSCHGGP